MAASTWNLANTTDIMLEPSTDGNFTAFGGGPAGLNNETDYFIQGSECESKNAWASAYRGMMHDEGADLPIGTDEVAMIWTIYHVPNALTDNAGAGETGHVIRAGSAVDANYYYFKVGDNLTLLFETWVPWVVNWDNSLESGTVGTPTATIDHIGAGWDVSANGPTKGSPAGIDCIREGRFELQYRDGDATPNGPNTFALAEAFSNDNSRRWGVLEFIAGTYRMQGYHSFGDASNPVYFQDSDVVLFIRDTPYAPAGFNRIEIENASTDVDWDNIIITALGTQSPGTFVVTSGAFDAVNCQFIGMGTFDFLSSSSATACVFAGTAQVTAPGTDLSGSQFVEPTVAADTAAVVWDTATDTDGLLDNTSFVSHPTTAHHAIEFSTFATSFDLVGIAFSGFGAEGANDAALYFPDTGSDRAWVVNLIGCTGTINFKKVRAGDTVSLVIDPVTLAITVENSAGTAISGARVIAEVTSAAGGWPYQESISIVQTAGTATATHTAHGLSTNDWVVIRGATQEEYNGVHQITVTGVNTYTFSVDSGATSPATGSPTATFAVIQGTTNVSGFISATYSYTANQPVRVRTRSATTPPYYKPDVRTVTIDSGSGASQTIALITDQ